MCVLTNHDFDIIIVSNTVQKMTLHLNNRTQRNFFVTTVYATCSDDERVSLWKNMYHLTEDVNRYWIKDFECYIKTCELSKVQYKGSPLT